MKTKIITTIIIGVLVLGGFVGLLVYAAGQPGKYDTFAQCIKDSGTKFYGAFWCPHCQATKAMFGKSAKYLPYVECSTPDRQQTKECKDKGITGYPTWTFANSTTTLGGEQKFEALAQASRCELPKN